MGKLTETAPTEDEDEELDDEMDEDEDELDIEEDEEDDEGGESGPSLDPPPPQAGSMAAHASMPAISTGAMRFGRTSRI